MYKIAISDLDGTLLGPDHRISTITKESIHRWLGDGRKFVIATGRHYEEAKVLQSELNEPIYFISSNGARVHNKTGKMVLKQNLPTDIAEVICNLDFDIQVQVNLFTDQYWYTNFEIKALAAYSLGGDFTFHVADLKKIDKSDTIKIVFWAKREKLTIIYDQLHRLFGDRINLTFTLDQCLEVMEANANKSTAIDAVLKEKNLTAEQAIAFGDGMNDIEMLKGVSKPILMANAQQELTNALPDAERTTSSAENGVAVKLNAILDTALIDVESLITSKLSKT